MKSKYQELSIDIINLDFDNPRIAKFLELYGKDTITSEAISLALGGGTDDKNGTSYSSLKESIKANQGIIHPIIVNRTNDGIYIVIEGNTRLQIYREFKESGVPGDWDSIRAIVYQNLTEQEIHAIRLQSHLVGPREWDPYSKAKYLNFLSNSEKMPMTQIISFCGGKSSEVKKYIDAYNDMERFYRKNLNNDSEFDQREFSKFIEFQNRGIKEALVYNKFDRDDYAKWVIEGNIDTATNVRKLPLILKNEEAREVFLKSNITEATKILALGEIEPNALRNMQYYQLASQLATQLKKIEYQEILKLKNDPRHEDKKNCLFDVLDELNTVIDVLKEE